MVKTALLIEGLNGGLTINYAQQAERAGFDRVWIP